MKYCPYCEGLIDNNSKKCKYCGELLDGIRLCPYCESIVSSTAIKCKYCGERMENNLPLKKQSNKIQSISIQSNNGSRINGRTGRIGFFNSYLLLILSGYVIALIYGVFNSKEIDEKSMNVIASLFVNIFIFPRRIRRLHDRGFPTRNIIVYLIPIWRIRDIMLFFAQGEKFGNKYGNVPKLSKDEKICITLLYIILIILFIMLASTITINEIK